MRQNDSVQHMTTIAPGISALRPYRSVAAETEFFPERAVRPRRFVTQSHALGGPVASPTSLLIAAAIAVVLYLVGRRMSD